MTEEQRTTLRAGLRAADAFRVRRCQILLASSRGQSATAIGTARGCSTQAVRNVLRAFERGGLACLTMQSRRPKSAAKLLDSERSERLRALLHPSPRAFGKARSLWILGLAAEVLWEQGITSTPVAPETIRDAIQRLGLSWQRAKDWITSPEPGYARKNSAAIG